MVKLIKKKGIFGSVDVLIYLVPVTWSMFFLSWIDIIAIFIPVPSVIVVLAVRSEAILLANHSDSI